MLIWIDPVVVIVDCRVSIVVVLFGCAPLVAVVDELQYDATRRRNLGGGGRGESEKDDDNDDDKSLFLCKRRFLNGANCEDEKDEANGKGGGSMGSAAALSLWISSQSECIAARHGVEKLILEVLQGIEKIDLLGTGCVVFVCCHGGSFSRM
jgi:hypothetical protein